VLLSGDRPPALRMATPAEGGGERKPKRLRPVAPSLRPRPVWAVELDIPDPGELQLLRAAAEKFFTRGRQGGTQADLVLIVLLPVWSGGAGRELLQTACGGASSSSALTLLHRGSPARTRLQVCMVFESGRIKSSVKRTTSALLQPLKNGEAAAASLVPVTFTTVLAHLGSQLATFALPRLKDQVGEYLSKRTAEDLDAAEPMDMTSDLLGPVMNRQQLQLLPPIGSEKATQPNADTEIEADTAPTQRPTEAPAPVELLTDLLTWSGELTQAMAAERAEAILQRVRSQTEELAIASSELNYLKWQESLKEEVRAYLTLALASHASSALLSEAFSLPLLVASAFDSLKPPFLLQQHLTRSNLQVKMSNGRQTLNEAHHEQSRRIASLVDMCSALKPLTLEKEQPNLHVVYMHAVALTDGR
jgi:hypothetical protein